MKMATIIYKSQVGYMIQLRIFFLMTKFIYIVIISYSKIQTLNHIQFYVL